MSVAVWFDLDRTLVEYDPSLPHLFAPALASHGVPADDDHLYDLLRRVVAHFEALDGDPFAGAATDLCEPWGLGDPEAFAADLVEAELAAMASPAAVERTLARLARRGAVGVLSNGYGPVQERKLVAADLRPHVETLLTPDALGAFKPAPEVFAAARDALPADRHVMVGDSVENDILPAREAGFETVLVGERDPRADHSLAGPGSLARLLALV